MYGERLSKSPVFAARDWKYKRFIKHLLDHISVLMNCNFLSLLCCPQCSWVSYLDRKVGFEHSVLKHYNLWQLEFKALGAFYVSWTKFWNDCFSSFWYKVSFWLLQGFYLYVLQNKNKNTLLVFLQCLNLWRDKNHYPAAESLEWYYRLFYWLSENFIHISMRWNTVRSIQSLIGLFIILQQRPFWLFLSCGAWQFHCNMQLES